MTEIPFQSQFEAAKAALPGDLLGLREDAFRRFADLGLPSQRREAWRYTRLSSLAKTELPLAKAGTAGSADVTPHLIEGAINMVFIDGHFDATASNLSDLPKGLIVESINAPSDAPAINSMLSHAADGTPDDALVALNTAMMADGAVVRLDKGAQIDRPIHLLFLATGAGMSHIRNIVVAAPASKATIVESYVGETDEAYWTNVVNQVALLGDAEIRHAKLQAEGANAWHIAATKLHTAENDRFDSVIAQLGGATARHEVSAVLEGEGVNARFAGVSIGTGKQLLDTITKLDHAVPNGVSDQLFKAVLDDQSHAVYQGKVIVRQDAQHTDARQANHNILLDRDAEATSKPELEIFADDVQCAHGATVGEMDKDMLFYMQARGHSEEEAEALLIEGFIVEVLERLEDGPLRNHIAAATRRKLGA